MSCLGGLILHPIYRLYLHRTLLEENKTNNSSKIIRMTCRRLQARVLLAGLALGPVLTVGYTKALGLTDEELRERCYRLRFNRSQLQTDRFTLALGFVGWYYTRWAGCVDGINIALAFTGAHNLMSKYIGSYPLYVDKIQNPPEDRDLLSEIPIGANIVASESPEWWESKSIAPPRPEGVRVKSNVKLW